MSRALACALLVALVLGGCGSKSPEQQFHDNAQAICHKAAERAEHASKSYGGQGTFAFLAAAYGVLAKARTELQALKAPAKVRAGYAAFLAAIKHAQPLLVRLAVYEDTQDRQHAQAILGQLGRSRLRARAVALGLPACASNVEPGRFAG